jgi:hypothetical protein
LWIGSWEVALLNINLLRNEDIGRTVIYSDSRGKSEAGTLVSWNNRHVFARYSSGDTAAASYAMDLTFGIKPLDGDLTRGEKR